MYNDVQSWFICLTFFQYEKLANLETLGRLYISASKGVLKKEEEWKSRTLTRIFLLSLKLLINIENANQSCKLFDNNAAVEINCEFSLLQNLFTALRDFTESSRCN